MAFNNFSSPCFKKIILSIFGVTGVFFTALLAASTDSENVDGSDPTRLVQSIIHGLDYVSVDYRAVVKEGLVVDENEFIEQLEIAKHTLGLMQTLPAAPAKETLVNTASALLDAVKNKTAGNEVTVLCHDMIKLLIDSYDVKTAPSTTPSLVEGQHLYQNHCAGCHGVEGLGDGIQAAALSPKPANFHDRERQQYRSVFALFNTISLGVNDTAMPAFSQLTAEQRWSLAFYVSNFFSYDAERMQGHNLWYMKTSTAGLNSLQQVAQVTPAEVREQWGHDEIAVLTYLRANPDLLPERKFSFIDQSRKYLSESLTVYRSGDNKAAYDLALASYLDGFEKIEAKLNTVAPDLRKQIERQMIEYRNLISAKAEIAQVKKVEQSLLYLLELAQSELGDSSASASVNFFTAMLILLREGLEAILVLAAMAVLVKSNQRRAIPYIHAGWMGALLFGVLTWYVAEYFININSASRELTEGLSALLAATMLFYVGFWLHNQTNSAQWRDYIRHKVTSALSDSALWGLTFVAFLAVYREVFESILFYRSLWLNAPVNEHSYVIGGIVAAAVLLLLLAWLIMRYSVRLPLKSFFRVNMVLMFALAIVFAGKGVVALQEAGKFPIDPIQFPQIDILGIYPNLESLGLQLGLICIVLTWAIYNYIKSNRQPPATPK